MRDNKRGTIEDRAMDALIDGDAGVIKRIPVQDESDPLRTLAKLNDLYLSLSRVEGVLERLFTAIAEATDLADVNIAAGIARQELSDV